MINKRWLIVNGWRTVNSSPSHYILWTSSIHGVPAWWSITSGSWIWIDNKWFVSEDGLHYHIPTDNVFKSYEEVISFIEMIQ